MVLKPFNTTTKAETYLEMLSANRHVLKPRSIFDFIVSPVGAIDLQLLIYRIKEKTEIDCVMLKGNADGFCHFPFHLGVDIETG